MASLWVTSAEAAKKEEDESTTWGDYGSAFLNVGGADVAGALPAGVRYVADQFDAPIAKAISAGAEYLQSKISEYGDDSLENLSPAAQKALSAEITSSDFWGSIPIKLTRMAPSVAASLASLIFTPAAVPAFVTIGATSGGLSAGQTLADMYSRVDNMTDDELVEGSDYYAGLRTSGLDEDKARKQLSKTMAGFKPAALFAIGAVTGNIGLAGQIARSLGIKGAGKAAEGALLQRAGKGLLAGGGSEAVQTGAEAFTNEQAGVDAGLQEEVDYGSVARQAAEGGVLGGLPGALADVVGGRKPAAPPAPAPVANQATPAAPTPAPAPTPSGVTATGQSVPSAPVAPPAGSKRPKKSAKKKVSQPATPAEVVDPIAPTAEQAAALATAPTPAPEVATPNVPPVVPQEQPVAAPPEPAPVPVQAPVAPAPVAPAPEPAPLAAAPVAPEPIAPAVAGDVAPAPAVVTPEVTPAPVAEPVVAPKAKALKEKVKAKKPQVPAVVEPALKGEIIAPGQPRILPDNTKADEAAAYEKVAAEAARKNKVSLKKAIKKEEAGGALGKNWTKAELEKRQADAVIAQRLFNDNVSGKETLPTTKTEREALLSRLEKIVNEAEGAGVAIPEKVTYEGTADHIIWLREAKSLIKAFKNTKKGPTPAHIQDFMMRERAAKAGDFTVMRSERKAAGEAAKRVDQGDVEAKATAPDASKDDPAVSTTKSAKRSVKAYDEEVAEETGAALLTTENSPHLAALKEKMNRELAEKAAKEKAAKEAPKAKAEPEVTPEVTPEPKPEPKPTAPVVTETKKEVDREAKKTEPDPTPKQAKAGNYEKGHPIIQGLRIAIETARGAIRRNKDPDGPKWEVKMPDHYGHILGTKGADGDPVDVYVGPKPDSEHVFVIDQQHITGEKAGQFDEHKVMLGYANLAAAMDAYDRGFSDGRGMERIKEWRIMSVPELKAWLKNEDTTQPATEEVAPAEAILDAQIRTKGYVGADNVEEAWRDSTGREGSPADPEFREYITAWNQYVDAHPGLGLRRAKVPTLAEIEAAVLAREEEQRPLTIAEQRDIIENESLQKGQLSDFASLVTDGINWLKAIWRREGGVAKIQDALIPAMFKRIAAVAGDVPVYVVPDEVYLRVNQNRMSDAFYHSILHIIVVPERSMNAESTPQLLIHEAAHAAFMKATWENPAIRGVVESIAAEAHAAFNSDGRQAYAFTNVDEFIAEALSNPEIQFALARTAASPQLAAGVEAARGSAVGRKFVSLWDVLMNIVRKALRLPGQTTSLLDAMFTAAAYLEQAAARDGVGPISLEQLDHRVREINAGPPIWEMSASRYGDTVDHAVTNFLARPEMQPQHGKPWLLKLRTLDNIARTADSFFGEATNPVRKIANLLETIRHSSNEYFRKAEPIIEKLYELEKKYAGAQWDEFTSLLMDEQSAGIFADKPLTHADNVDIVGKDTLHGAWPKAKHAALAARWAALPQDLKDARAAAFDHYTTQQNEMAFGNLANRVLKVLGVEDAALAQRIFDGTQTAADVQKVGGKSAMDVILKAKELSKIKGPYIPLMRRGDFVVVGYHQVSAPANATSVGTGNEAVFEFKGKDARKEALDWASKQDLRPTVESVWVDSATGKTHVIDPATGDEVKIRPQDFNAEQRFRVTLQNKHVEFFDTAKEARAAAFDLNKAGVKTDGVEPRRYEPEGRHPDLVSGDVKTLMNSLRQREGFKKMSAAQQNELMQAMNEASIRLLGSTRIQSHRLPRRHVQGASRDMVRNALDYTQSVSGYLARLKHLPALEAAMKEMREATRGDYSDPNSLSRGSIANEVARRVDGRNGLETKQTKYSPWVQRLLTTSFIARLASPAYSIINATQPMMVTMPVLGARFGVGRAVAAMSKAYADISAGKVVRGAVKDTFGRVVRPGHEGDTYIDDIKARLTDPQERAAVDVWVQRGVLTQDAGLEIPKLIRSRGRNTLGEKASGGLDTGIAYIEGIARQLPIGIESINRSVAALAAFRLELARSGDFDKAVQYGQDIANQTQFLYSNTNAAPVFNHPLARLSFQFKKFGVGMYQLLGEQVAKAIRNEKPGDRAEAARALAYIAATHMALAGVLGLPTEPIRILVTAANIFGLTSLTWGDIEDWERQIAADLLGKTGGEMVSRGLTRGLPGGFSFDLSSRVGLNNLMVFDEPQTNDPDDVQGWVANVVFGAPGGLVKEWVSGSQDLLNGEFEKAGEKLVPIKGLRDALSGYRKLTEGKKNKTGRQTMEPYSVAEAAVRAIGFNPGREAEDSAMRGVFHSNDKRTKDQRSELFADWANAAPNERARMWGKVEKWNKGKKAGEKITRAQLDAAVKRRRTEEKKGSFADGLRISKSNSGNYKKIQETYNYE